MSATGAKGSQAAKGRSAYSTSSRSDVFRDVSDGEGTAATGRGTDSQPNGEEEVYDGLKPDYI